MYAGGKSIQQGSDRLKRGLTGSRSKPAGLGYVSQGRSVALVEDEFKTKIYRVSSLEERVEHIAKLAHKGKTDPTVIRWIRTELSKKCRDGWNGEQWCIPEKDTMAEIKAIYALMRRDVRYTSDIRGIDTFAHPKRVLEMSAEDCDGYAALGCAALMAVGIPCGLKVIRTKQAEDWDHIFIIAGTPKNDPKKWIALDASVPAGAGWAPPANMVAASKVFFLDDYTGDAGKKVARTESR